MVKENPDKKADIFAATDRLEEVFKMEPTLIQEGAKGRAELLDLALELATKCAALRHSLPRGILATLSDLVRSMNCYYSNLIEGHNMHPIDIERALKQDYSADRKKRDLQLEALAHLSVQRWIDEGGVVGRATSAETLCEIHRRFCERLPETLLWIEEPQTGRKEKIEAGSFRIYDVQVGGHVAISPGSVPRFLARFEKVYGGLGKTERIISCAASHHRFLWIHPFLDGNGRVARLMSHAILLDALDTGGIWSISRGLARNAAEYKDHLANCDQTRRNDLDGRGNLSEEALIAFSNFFLRTCIDQVDFMASLIEPERLRKRIIEWANRETVSGKLPSKASLILEAILFRGEIDRSEIAPLMGASDRHARRLISALISASVLGSTDVRGPLRLQFPATLAPHFLPGLFPNQ